MNKQSVLIRCPVAGSPVNTAMSSIPEPRGALRALHRLNACAACGSDHTWSSNDAWYSGEPERQAPVGDWACVLNSNVGELLFVEGSSVAESVKKHVLHDPGVEYFMGKHPIFPFFDVGANVGLFSILAAKSGGPVFAFEPEAKNLDALERNVRSHGVDIRVWPLACAQSDGVIELGVLPCGLSVKSKESVVRMQGRTLKGIIRETGVAPAFMKLDIEGGELDALLGFEGAPGWERCVLEVEFSWRDHGKHIEEFFRLRPVESYDWEFLLSASETSIDPSLKVRPVTFKSPHSERTFFSCTAVTKPELERVLAVLARSTEDRASRKWEVCISPRA